MELSMGYLYFKTFYKFTLDKKLSHIPFLIFFILIIILDILLLKSSYW